MNMKDSKVLYNIPVGPSCYKLGLEAGYEARTVFPGQFVMIQVSGQPEPLLRRPFSIYNAFGKEPGHQNIEVLYKVVGKGTEKLSQVNKGAEINILGPLGKGFAIPEKPGRTCLVAGGIGIAPLYFLVSRLLKNGWVGKDITLFFGAQSKPEMALIADFENLPINVQLTTDDGSFGQKGFVTDLLEIHLKQASPDVMYACGPMPMLKTVASLAGTCEISCQVSLETVMACGMGACLGCAVKNSRNTDKYAHVCVDGPVFDLKDFQF